MLRDNLKGLRARKGISQIDLAKNFGLSQPTIASWESGRTEPSTDMLKRLARYFGVTTDYLLGNETSAEPVEKDDAVRMYRQLPAADKDMVARMIAALFAQCHNSVAASHVGA